MKSRDLQDNSKGLKRLIVAQALKFSLKCLLHDCKRSTPLNHPPHTLMLNQKIKETHWHFVKKPIHKQVTTETMNI